MGVDPLTLGLVAAGGSGALSLASGAMGAADARQQGRYRAAVARNQAAVAEQNALRAERDADIEFDNAGRVILAGGRQARDQDRKAAEQIGEVRAVQSASGVTGTSQQRVISMLQRLAGVDRQRIVDDAGADAETTRRRGQSFLNEAADLRSGANNARTDARMAIANSKSAARSSLLEGVAGALGAGGQAGTMLATAQSPSRANFFARRRGNYAPIWRP